MNTDLTGRRVRLIKMDDLYAPEPGTLGTIAYVDDDGNVHVGWDNQSTLSLIPNIDTWEVLP